MSFVGNTSCLRLSPPAGQFICSLKATCGTVRSSNKNKGAWSWGGFFFMGRFFWVEKWFVCSPICMTACACLCMPAWFGFLTKKSASCSSTRYFWIENQQTVYVFRWTRWPCILTSKSIIFGTHPPSICWFMSILGSSQLKSTSSVPIILIQGKYIFVSKNHTWKASSSYFKQSGHFFLFRDPYWGDPYSCDKNWPSNTKNPSRPWEM